MPSFHLHIQGQVQGVGFRPFVYRLALRQNLLGWVSNTVDGVHIELNVPSEAKVVDFLQQVLKQAPALAIIRAYDFWEIAPKHFDSFEIIHEEIDGLENLLLSPDFGLCADCRQELKHSEDRRYQYPFITCTNCGPRFSILQALPYDRDKTTMASFPMCADCQEEYDDPLQRRYYSQTNSCPQCAINLSLYDSKQNLLARSQEGIIERVGEALREGQIVAVKGIGGYLLLTDATNEKAILDLRARKHRPTKPFALLYPDLSTLQGDVHLSEIEIRHLQSTQAPIVLLALRENPSSGICWQAIAPKLHQIGAMLPYAPLLEIIAGNHGQALVATSANLSGSPIIYQDQAALADLSGIADLVLTHDREILIPQDDSVRRFTKKYQTSILLRRSRGYAPTYLNAQLDLGSRSCLALGGDLKSSFALIHQQNLYLSQFLGDLAEYRSQEGFRQTLEHFLKIFKAQPEVVISDWHPDYFSTRLAENLAEEWQVPHVQIQHHEAHAYAILGEHAQLATREPVLCVIWDGMGYGAGEQIWGGEFFLYQAGQMERVAHLPYFDYFLGDQMSKQPRLAALSLVRGQKNAEKYLKAKFTEQEWKLYLKMLTRSSFPQTSSVGRLFDAMASLLGLADQCSYEGEAALYLESMARDYLNQEEWRDRDEVFPLLHHEGFVWEDFTTALLEDLDQGKSSAYLAAKFHYSLAKGIENIAQRFHAGTLAFSGGVFQNALLVDLIQEKLGESHELLFHQQVSPNDENIALGQLIAYHQSDYNLPKVSSIEENKIKKIRITNSSQSTTKISKLCV